MNFEAQKRGHLLNGLIFYLVSNSISEHQQFKVLTENGHRAIRDNGEHKNPDFFPLDSKFCKVTYVSHSILRCAELIQSVEPSAVA